MSDHAAIARLAERLAGVPVSGVRNARGGGNNEVFRIDTARGPFALKRYPQPDPRDRLGHEYESLTFLHERGETAVAAPLAVDRAAAVALYEWIDGEPVRPDVAAVDAMLGLAARLHAAGRDPAAARLPPATEAVRQAADLGAQIVLRLERLEVVAVHEPELAIFLGERFGPLWERLRRAPGAVTQPGIPTLSASDFGTHNMLRRPDGRFAFIDFEYFGWDDPVKLVCDVIWHPAMALERLLARQFLDGAADIYHDDPLYPDRLREWFPLFGLRWALIVLNEFVPELWERRRRAGAALPWSQVKTQQLAKAQALVTRAALGMEPVWTS
jgi:Ser/Thr protein kinase RdoA (MazF antagonist)